MPYSPVEPDDLTPEWPDRNPYSVWGGVGSPGVLESFFWGHRKTEILKTWLPTPCGIWAGAGLQFFRVSGFHPIVLWVENWGRNNNSCRISQNPIARYCVPVIQAVTLQATIHPATAPHHLPSS
jgi:hypothetical protein